MYTIIGGDGKEYGPVSVDQVRAWMSTGRANAATRIKAAGSDSWTTIGELPEFSQGASAALPPSLPEPAAPALPPLAEFSVGACYGRAWEFIKKDFWPIVGVCLLALVVMAVSGVIPFSSILVAPAVTGGLYYYLLLKIRGQPAVASDIFSGFSRAFLNLVLAELVIAAFTAIGFLLLILPGIYLVVAYVFTYILCTDRKLGFWEAMELSRKVTTRKWWSVFGLLLLSIPINLLGVLALGVGIFVTIPLTLLALVYAYEDLFNPKA